MKTKKSLVTILALALTLPIATMMIAAQTATPVPPSRPDGPCDIYNAAGTPCVTAHSTTRALTASYNGPLYQVTRKSDGRTLDIGIVQPAGTDPGGYADAAAQDAFCADTLCVISRIYDQSGMENHLYQAPPGTFVGPAKGGFNTLPIADMAPVTVSGHKVYGVYIIPGMGLRNNNASGLAINDEPQGVYMVFDGTHYDSGCCFNYGNTSTSSEAVGRGTMDTVYFGTATAWGRGSGSGPWIMSDMEAGLFSGYAAGVNEGSPTIDSWRFVTGMVNGGGGNQWEIRGANAQEGALTTFYKGLRPGSNENDFYYPMHRKGAVQMGNGGDNGNGSAGTFYEGVMTTGYPSDETIHAVQANIVSARYDVQPVHLSRVTTFSPGSAQEAIVTFNNITGIPVTDLKLNIALPTGWTAVAAGTTEPSKTFSDPVAPGAHVSATFKITPPATPSAGYLTGRASWTGRAGDEQQTIAQRVRNAFPVKINEVRLTNQFIELYNASDKEVDLSGWSLIHTRSQWAPVKLAAIPSGTKIAANGFYLLGLSSSGLAAPAEPGDAVIHVRSTTGYEVGQQVSIGNESRAVTAVGTPAAAMTTLFIPVSTGPWLTFPAGSTTLPVTSANGFEVGQKIGIDMGGNYELATVTAVGKASTQTTLSQAAATGTGRINLADVSNISIGDTLTVDTGARIERVKVAEIDNSGVVLETPLTKDHMQAVDVSNPGTGISFLPATRFSHRSGDAVQALGSGITLDRALAGSHAYGAAVVNSVVTTGGYTGTGAPDQWFGDMLSDSAGSIALMDASGKVVVDAMVYGSQQSSSSANGTIASPELATLEGDQSQGGCIVVVPSTRRGGFGRRGGPGEEASDRSLGRYPDGNDTDSNCNDYQVQTSSMLSLEAAEGANNIKVASIAEFNAGQTLIIGTGEDRETIDVAAVGTGGGTATLNAVDAGATVIPVMNTAGFSVGQTITVDSGASIETAVVASMAGGRGGFGARAGARGASITVTEPLSAAHPEGAQVAGTGITLTRPLTRAYVAGVPVAAGVPTPGAPNRY